MACSGGPDSAVLLHVLHRLAPELRLELRAASVNHGLRADAAGGGDGARRVAVDVGVPVSALWVTVPAAGPSRQEKARRVRYRALRGEAERLGASLVAVGHTLDDQAETVLARLLRGSGVRGLAGIEPLRADGVIRPLLDCSRADIHAYARRHDLPHVRDPSNEDEAFTRARLRKRVMPTLVTEDPQAVAHLAQVADEAREIRAFVREAAQTLAEHAARGQGPRSLRVEPLLAAPRTVRAEVLSRWVEALVGAPARRAHLIALEGALTGNGEVLLPGALRVALVQGLLVARDAPDQPVRGRRG